MRIMAQTHKCKNVATTTNALLACHLIDTNLKSVPARKAKKPDRSTGFGTSQVIISPTNKISHSHGSPYLYSFPCSFETAKENDRMTTAKLCSWSSWAVDLKCFFRHKYHK